MDRSHEARGERLAHDHHGRPVVVEEATRARRCVEVRVYRAVHGAHVLPAPREAVGLQEEEAGEELLRVDLVGLLDVHEVLLGVGALVHVPAVGILGAFAGAGAVFRDYVALKVITEGHLAEGGRALEPHGGVRATEVVRRALGALRVQVVHDALLLGQLYRHRRHRGRLHDERIAEEAKHRFRGAHGAQLLVDARLVDCCALCLGGCPSNGSADLGVALEGVLEKVPAGGRPRL